MSLESLNPEFSDQQRKSSSNASTMRNESTSVVEIENSNDVVATSDDISPVPDSISNKEESNETIDENKRKEYPTEWNFSMNIPQTSYRRPIEIPAEEIGHGVNRYVYYVCTNLYDEWIELPSATPHQINVSRRMKKYLTGNLDAEIPSYPIFPGTERNYLRAIIARISSSTHVAPRNFYEIESNKNVVDGEEEDDDLDEDKCSKFLSPYSLVPFSILPFIKSSLVKAHKNGAQKKLCLLCWKKKSFLRTIFLPYFPFAEH
jgi:hypothetical protein